MAGRIKGKDNISEILKWEPVDIIALIVVTVIAFILITPLMMGEELSKEGREIYSEVIMGFLSVVLIYVGYKLKK